MLFALCILIRRQKDSKRIFLCMVSRAYLRTLFMYCLSHRHKSLTQTLDLPLDWASTSQIDGINTVTLIWRQHRLFKIWTWQVLCGWNALSMLRRIDPACTPYANALHRGIADESAPSHSTSSWPTNTDALRQRCFIFVEWQKWLKSYIVYVHIRGVTF